MNKNDLNIGVIIQARMGSARLPGKVMTDIEGQPMLWHVVQRLKHSQFLNHVIVATSENVENDLIEDFCLKNEITYFRGCEEDVLYRYYKAAKMYELDVIVRVTADCPLIDPRVIDKAISKFLEQGEKIELASTILRRTYPRGLDAEVLSMKVLKRLQKIAPESEVREHVTLYLYQDLKNFSVISVENDQDLSHLRWTVDQQEDLEFVKAIYKRLYKSNKMFYLNEIIEVLENEPHLLDINKNVQQKRVAF